MSIFIFALLPVKKYSRRLQRIEDRSRGHTFDGKSEINKDLLNSEGDVSIQIHDMDKSVKMLDRNLVSLGSCDDKIDKKPLFLDTENND